MALGPLLILLLAVGTIGLVVLLVVLLSRPKPTAVPVVSAHSINPTDRQQLREAILEQLSRKEINQDEAERQLLELDNPVPEEMPPPPQRRNGRGCGCLIAATVAIALLALLLPLLLFFAVSVTPK